jgi:hypothetical protein
MESLFRPMKLTPELSRVLEEIRNGAENALSGASPAVADALFRNHIESLISGAGLPNLQVIHYRWFLRELARLWRTRQGRDLAFHLELCLRKWRSLGLEPRTLQFLVCEAYSRLKSQSAGNDPGRAESAPAAVPGPVSRSTPASTSAYDERMSQPMSGPRPPAAGEAGGPTSGGDQ